jgi:hypothetical protein
MPHFWSRIIFVSPSRRNNNRPRRDCPNFSPASWFLKNAPKRQRSTTIDIVIREIQVPFTTDEILTILKILFNSPRGRIGRWRSVTIDVASEDILHTFFSQIACPPSLKDPRLHVVPPPRRRQQIPLNLQKLDPSCQRRSVIRSSPLPIFPERALRSLKMLSLKHFDVDWLQISDQLEEARLEELILEDINACDPDNSGSLLKLLSMNAATSLHRLTMVNMGMFPATGRRVHPVLKGLSSLKLAWRISGFHSMARIFNTLETPSLHELVLADLAEPTTVDSFPFQFAMLGDEQDQDHLSTARAGIQPILDTMLARSQSATIIKLHINGIRINPDLSDTSPVDQFRTLLSSNSLDNVESLFLRDTDKFLIEALFLGRDVNDCMPSLRTVYLDQPAEKACQEFIYESTGLHIDLKNTFLSLGRDKPIRFQRIFEPVKHQVMDREIDIPVDLEEDTSMHDDHSSLSGDWTVA